MIPFEALFLDEKLILSSSACHGESNPEARTRLRGEFDEILEVTFGSGQTELVVRLYFRERDHRARVLCKWPRSSGDGSKYSCLPLNVLEFHRIDSSLQLCKKRPGSSKLDLWASLKFSTIESMSITLDHYQKTEKIYCQGWSSSIARFSPYELMMLGNLFGTSKTTSLPARQRFSQGKSNPFQYGDPKTELHIQPNH